MVVHGNVERRRPINWVIRWSLHLAEIGTQASREEKLHGPPKLRNSLTFPVGNIVVTLNQVKLSGVHGQRYIGDLN